MFELELQISSKLNLHKVRMNQRGSTFKKKNEIPHSFPEENNDKKKNK